MKYIALSLRYVFKNFLKLLVFAAVPALLLALCFDIPAFSEVIRQWGRGESAAFETVYFRLSLFANRFWWLRVITVLLFVLVMGIMLSTIDRHMRIGKFSFRFLHRLDEVLFMILPIGLIGIAITEFFAFINSCLIILFGLFIPATAMPYFAVTFLIFMALLWSLCLVLFINCVPCMIVQGYPFGESLGTSVRMVSKKLFRMLLAFVFPFVVIVPLMLVADVFFGVWRYPVYFICYAFLIMYYAAFSMSSYFENFGYERHDVRRDLFKR